MGILFCKALYAIVRRGNLITFAPADCSTCLTNGARIHATYKKEVDVTMHIVEPQASRILRHQIDQTSVQKTDEKEYVFWVSVVGTCLVQSLCVHDSSLAYHY